MIGLTILSLAAAALVVPSAAQEEYRVARPSKVYASLNDDVAYENPTTPVPILKQINNHNDDGSYTYGFEAADGSFKIETKEANGQVRGKYGYTDANGKLQVVEYGANKFGFQPTGDGIDVPPVNYDVDPEEEVEEPQQIIPIKQSRRPQPAPQPAYRPAPQPALQPAYRPAPQQAFRPAPQPAPQPIFRAPAPALAPVPRPQAEPHIIYSSPVPRRPSAFSGATPIQEAQQESFDYDQPAPQPRPAPRPAPRPQPIQYAQPIQYSRPKPSPAEAPIANFIPSAEFRQAISFDEPQYRPVSKPTQFQSIEQPQTFFRSDLVAPSRPKPQPVRFAQTEAIISEEPRQYIPKKPKTKVGGFFDQLEEQFSLPNSEARAQHDVSFGFF